MNACGSGSPSLGLHSMPILPSPPSLTLLTRYVPASTGVQGKRLTSQRGVVPIHCGGVLVVLASWRAACAPSVWAVIDSAPEVGVTPRSYTRCHAQFNGRSSQLSVSSATLETRPRRADVAPIGRIRHRGVRHEQRP